MQARCLTAVTGLFLFSFASLAHAVCDPADQIAPNPGGNTLTLTSSTACNAVDPYENLGTLSNEGTLVNEGSITGPQFATLQNNGTLVNDGSAYSHFFRNDGTLINNGEAGANFIFSNSGTVSNSGQLFATDAFGNAGTLNNSGSIEVSNGGAGNSGLLVNNGTFNSAGGLFNQGVLYNNGTFSGVTGDLNNVGTVFNAGRFSTFGGANNSGQISILEGGEVSGFGDYSQTDGSTTVDGALRLQAVGISGGVLTGSGSITGAVTVDGGTIAVGNSPGSMSIIGDYTQTMAGSFEAEIGGLLQGIEYDYLSVSGTAALDGLLDVRLYDLGDGVFAPNIGDTFDILSADSIIGSFSNFAFAALDAGLEWQVSYLTDFYGTRDVVRLQVAAVPEPEIYAMMGIGLGLMGWAARRKQRQQAAT